MFLIIAGNPADGFNYIGPFSDGNYANDWAEYSLPSDAEYWIVEMEQPTDEEE